MFPLDAKWRLHVVEAHGPANTWESSVAIQPGRGAVFAVLPGWRQNWARCPCLLASRTTLACFPNVGAAGRCREGFLRAVLFARRPAGSRAHSRSSSPWKQPHWSAVRRLVQWYRAADIGAAACKSLAMRVARSGSRSSRAYSGRVEAGRVCHPPSRTSAPEMTWCLGYVRNDLAALGTHPVKADGV